jgi:hypothetical protein
MHNPAISDWEKLYQAAIKFQRIAPWTWMENQELFAVENPVSEEMGYCSILGYGQEIFGMDVFLGAQGYARYLEIISSEAGAEDTEATLMTPTLLLLFGNRAELQKEDLEVIRSLGLQFRGRNAWPLFRSLRPGYAPYFLEKEEAVYLTAALEQALAVAGKVRQDGLDLFEETGEDLVFTRYCRNHEWKEKWRQPDYISRDASAKREPLSAVNEAELLVLRNSAGKLSGIWELDIFILPMATGPVSERPYFPLCFLAVDREQELIINTLCKEPWLTLSQKQETVLQILKKARPLPQNIRVKSAQIKDIVEPLTRSLGINLRVGPLLVLEEIKASLQDHLTRRGSKRR